LAEWWQGEITTDPTYAGQIVPLAVELLGGAGGPFLDLGCGEGQLLRALGGGQMIGCDFSLQLLGAAKPTAPVVQCLLPDLSWIKTDAFDAAACVLVLEHLADVSALFGAVARVVRTHGALVVVMNHPAYTPDGAGPLIDTSDGEVLWRWGNYFDEGIGIEPAGSGSVVFHHRPLGMILNAASANGFDLEHLEEVGMAPEAGARDPGFAGQEHLPRLLGARWRRR
jgi:SAM-dependent methyltransferase